MSITLADIEQAAARLAGEIVRTPAAEAPRLTQVTGAARVVLKLENQQFTGSFKDRGALNKLKTLAPAEAARGVIAMSAGNHAQGVAYHAQRLGIPATIVMPKGSPFTKVLRTRAFGARVLLEGDGIDAAAVFARELGSREGLTFVHPYDDPLIVAGQGTAALELLADAPDLDLLVVPIGGGGLIAGMAVAARALRPGIEILGVEAALYPSMKNAIAGQPPTSGGQTIAEGIAVKAPGAITRPVIERLVGDIVLVEEDPLERAVEMLIDTQKVVAEGGGAAALAALLVEPQRFAGRKVGLVVSGGNIDARLLAQVLMRGLVRQGRVVTLRVEIVDMPGALGHIARVIGETGGNIIEIYHQRLFYDLPVKRADLDIVVETRNLEHVQEIIDRLARDGFATRQLSAHSSREHY
jgi:threonine dehydratase